MLILLSVSGFPIVSQNRDLSLMLAAIIFSLIIFIKYGSLKILLNGSFGLIFFSLTLIFVLQSVLNDNFSLTSFGGLIARIVIAYNVFVLLNRRFIPVFISVMLLLSLISISVYIITLVFPEIRDLGFTVLEDGRLPQKSIIIYNFMSNVDNRLVGPFWEPGAFAGFLVLAIYFNLFYVNYDFLSKSNLVMCLALILTFSTMGYISVFIVIFIYLIHRKGLVVKLLIIPLIFFVGLAIFKLDFLGDKLQNQMNDLVIFSSGQKQPYNSQRFISTYVDYEDFVVYPLLGTGISNYSRFELLKHESVVRTNGFMDILLKFGLIGISVIMFSYLNHFKSSFYSYKAKKIRYITLLIFIIINLSQLFFYLPFFMVFYFSNRSKMIG